MNSPCLLLSTIRGENWILEQESTVRICHTKLLIHWCRGFEEEWLIVRLRYQYQSTNVWNKQLLKPVFRNFVLLSRWDYLVQFKKHLIQCSSFRRSAFVEQDLAIDSKKLRRRFKPIQHQSSIYFKSHNESRYYKDIIAWNIEYSTHVRQVLK